MGINLKTFRKVTNGFARKHHFNIGFPDWRGLGLTGGIASKLVGTAATPVINAFASTMEMPTKQITTHDIPISSGIPPIKIAKNVNYGEWSVNFYSDELLLLRYFFLEWMELINNTKDHTYSVPSRYKSNLAFGAVLSPEDIPVQVYGFKGLFPISVGGVQMAQQDTEVLIFNVKFAYDFFTVNEPTSFALAVGLEVIGSAVLNRFGSGTTGLGRRTLNAPLGVSVPIPF